MPTILIVDDDPGLRKPLARLLSGAGYEVFCAENAVMALAAAVNHAPDLILLDVAIPPMDGLTFLWLLREKAAGREIAVVIYTAMEDEQTQVRARELGVREYVIKSHCPPRELVALARRYAGEPTTSPGTNDCPDSPAPQDQMAGRTNDPRHTGPPLTRPEEARQQAVHTHGDILRSPSGHAR